MLAFIKNSSSLVCVAATLLFHFGGLECAAQNDDASLFIVQSPPLPRTPILRNSAKFIRAFPASTQSTQQAVDSEAASAPVTSRRAPQPVDFADLEIDPVQVEDDDLLNEIKELDKSLNEEDSANGDENDLDRLIDESADQDDADQDEQENEAAQKKPSPPPVTTWSMKPMSLIRPSIRPTAGESPEDQSWQLTSRESLPLAASNKLYAWAAPNIKHTPLYFEDVALERYGQTKGLLRQPIASSFHFLKSAALLPYHSIYDPINSCDGPLGYCRPGTHVNCVDQRHYFGNPFRR